MVKNIAITVVLSVSYFGSSFLVADYPFIYEYIAPILIGCLGAHFLEVSPIMKRVILSLLPFFAAPLIHILNKEGFVDATILVHSIFIGLIIVQIYEMAHMRFLMSSQRKQQILNTHKESE